MGLQMPRLRWNPLKKKKGITVYITSKSAKGNKSHCLNQKAMWLWLLNQEALKSKVDGVGKDDLASHIGLWEDWKQLQSIWLSCMRHHFAQK